MLSMLLIWVEELVEDVLGEGLCDPVGEEARLGRIEAEGGIGDVLVDGRGTAAGLDTLLHGLRHYEHK